MFGSSSPQDRRKDGLRRTLFARQDKNRIRTSIAQTSQHPGDHQPEIGVGMHVEERAQGLDREANGRMGGLSMTRQPAASISTARNSLIADRRLNLPQGFQFRKQVLIWSLVVLMSAGRLSLSAFSSCTAFTRSATE